jgi:threonine synthase
MKELNLLQEVTNFKCISCKLIHSIDYSRITCTCSGLLEVIHNWDKIDIYKELDKFKHVFSGVWRFKPLIHPTLEEKDLVTRGEGRTGLYKTTKKIISFSGTSNIQFKHEGENPTGSFKDRGMTVAISEAVRKGIKKVLCASTGNTSASLAAYAAYADLESYVVIPKGKVAVGKLAQALAYGANILEIDGTFDTALSKVKEYMNNSDMYVLNSINPWRIEGQKTIIFELLEQRNWQIPDFIVVPAGNLGNTSAFGKALREAKEIGLINDLPRIVSVQADTANPFTKFWQSGTYLPEKNPNTLATAINIGDPVNVAKASKSIKETNGLVISVSDQEILDAKAVIDSSGIGCEPASAATLAGIKYLFSEGEITVKDQIVAILTGHLLKDTQIISNYHNNNILGINPKYINKFKK